MADNTEDPIADVPPDQAHVQPNAPVVSSANGMLLLVFTHVMLLVYYRMAWYAIETLLFDHWPAIGAFRSYILIPYLVPVAGLLVSLLSPAAGSGAFAGWTIAILAIGGLFLGISTIWVLISGMPPQSIELAASLFKSGSPASASLGAA